MNNSIYITNALGLCDMGLPSPGVSSDSAHPTRGSALVDLESTSPDANYPPIYTPEHVFRTPSKFERFTLPEADDSPTTSAIPSLEPGSSASSAMTRSPISPSRRTPYTPSSFNNRLLHPSDGPIKSRDIEANGKLYQNPESFIQTWLHDSTLPGLSPQTSIPPSPIIFAPFDATIESSPRGLRHAQDGTYSNELYKQHNSSFSYEAPGSKHHENNDLFPGANVDLYFELERSANIGVLEALSSIPRPHVSTTQSNPIEKDDLYYDPELDGTTTDESILRQNMLNPWPYDQQSFYHRRGVYNDPTPISTRDSAYRRKHLLNRSSSRFLAQASALLAKNSRLRNHGPSMLNSEIPHPEWGSFKFRSNDDGLDEDEEDGDVQVWLTRVTRRNARTTKGAFGITSGIHRPLTIEEYERRGSWIFEQEWEEEMQAMSERRKKQEMTEMAELQTMTPAPPRSDAKKANLFRALPLAKSSSSLLAPTQGSSCVRSSPSLVRPFPPQSSSAGPPSPGIYACPRTIIRGAKRSVCAALHNAFRRCKPLIRRKTASVPSILQRPHAPSPSSTSDSPRFGMDINPFDEGFGPHFHPRVSGRASLPNSSFFYHPVASTPHLSPGSENVPSDGGFLLSPRGEEVFEGSSSLGHIKIERRESNPSSARGMEPVHPLWSLTH